MLEKVCKVDLVEAEQDTIEGDSVGLVESRSHDKKDEAGHLVEYLTVVVTDSVQSCPARKFFFSFCLLIVHFTDSQETTERDAAIDGSAHTRDESIPGSGRIQQTGSVHLFTLRALLVSHCVYLGSPPPDPPTHTKSICQAPPESDYIRHVIVRSQHDSSGPLCDGAKQKG